MRLPLSPTEGLIHLELLHLALQAAWADGRLAPEEVLFLKALASDLRMPRAKQVELECYLRADHPRLPCPNLGVLRKEAPHDALHIFTEVILCDRELAEEEVCLYCELLGQLGIPEPVSCCSVSEVGLRKGRAEGTMKELALYVAEQMLVERRLIEQLLLDANQRRLLRLLAIPRSVAWLVRHSDFSPREMIDSLRVLKKAGLVQLSREQVGGIDAHSRGEARSAAG